jgi:hypothetical protein
MRWKRRHKGKGDSVLGPPLQIGLDVVRFSTLGDSCSRVAAAVVSILNIPGYRRHRSYIPRRRGYGRCTEYQHVTDRRAPVIEVYRFPKSQYFPVVRVFIRASIRRLMDCDTVERIASLLSERLGIPLRVAEVELAADFKGNAATTAAVNRQHYVPRVRSALALRFAARPDGRTLSTTVYYRGRRRSAWSARSYVKREDGVKVARVEWVQRRGALRALGIESASDLRRLPWADVILSRSRFVRFDSGLFAGDHERAWKYAHFIDLYGPNYALTACIPLKDRHRVRQAFRVTGTQAAVEAALRAFERRQRRCDDA